MQDYSVIRLWADRVRMVRRYLVHPGLWPDGIDSRYERWYLGHEGDWGRLVGHLDSGGGLVGGIGDEEAFRKFGEREVVFEGEEVGRPWEVEGVSRATWFRRRLAREGLEGGGGEG